MAQGKFRWSRMHRIRIMNNNRVQGSGFGVQRSGKILYPVPCTLYPEKAFTIIELFAGRYHYEHDLFSCCFDVWGRITGF